MIPHYRSLTNLMANQVLWFAGIIGGDDWAIGLGVAYAFFYIRFIGNLHKEWHSVVLIAVIGFVTDLLLSYAGVIHFSSDLSWPAWLLVLWISFATLMHHGLEWLQGRLALSMLAGAILGPLSYYTGAQLGDSDIVISLHIFISVYACIWAIFMPLFLIVAKR